MAIPATIRGTDTIGLKRLNWLATLGVSLGIVLTLLSCKEPASVVRPFTESVSAAMTTSGGASLNVVGFRATPAPTGYSSVDAWNSQGFMGSLAPIEGAKYMDFLIRDEPFAASIHEREELKVSWRTLRLRHFDVLVPGKGGDVSLAELEEALRSFSSDGVWWLETGFAYRSDWKITDSGRAHPWRVYRQGTAFLSASDAATFLTAIADSASGTAAPVAEDLDEYTRLKARWGRGPVATTETRRQSEYRMAPGELSIGGVIADTILNPQFPEGMLLSSGISDPVERVESQIDGWDSTLPPLASIGPGGCQLGRDAPWFSPPMWHAPQHATSKRVVLRLAALRFSNPSHQSGYSSLLRENGAVTVHRTTSYIPVGTAAGYTWEDAANDDFHRSVGSFSTGKQTIDVRLRNEVITVTQVGLDRVPRSDWVEEVVDAVLFVRPD